MPVGTNVITLQAVNSKGLSATITVTVVVDDNLGQPGATLTVSPGQVGWHINEGITALQTYDLKINDSGGSTSIELDSRQQRPGMADPQPHRRDCTEQR